MTRSLVLGSSSPYRKELLSRLHLPFSVDAPDLDETPQPGETASDLVNRLACAKALRVAERHPDALIISSDQCAELDGLLIGKPGRHEVAVEQLHALSGQTVTFVTGLCLFDSRDRSSQYRECRYRVHYKTLAEDDIQHYLELEQPYHCTASFKSEGLGVALVRGLEGEDPTALIGLPLLSLINLLQTAGVQIFSP